jgi:hypothetical protein
MKVTIPSLAVQILDLLNLTPKDFRGIEIRHDGLQTLPPSDQIIGRHPGLPLPLTVAVFLFDVNQSESGLRHDQPRPLSIISPHRNGNGIGALFFATTNFF